MAENTEYNFSTVGTTAQECYRVETAAQGAALYEAFVQYCERENHMPRAAAEKTARRNLGYIIGYMEPAIARQKAYEMIGLLHPAQTGELQEMVSEKGQGG